MSLQVWLPLNGNLNNQGLTNINAINNGATVNASGKIGSCYQFGTAASDITIPKEAMTSFTTEASVCFWIKILTWNTSYATFFQAGPASTAWTAYIFGLLRNNANSTCCFTISNGSSASNASYLTPSLDLNVWYHISLIYKTGHCLIYINGQLYQDYTTSIAPNFSNITTIKLGRCANGSSYQTNCQMNDFRIYNHALSVKEVEEISKGLVLHYKLDGFTNITNPNLIKDSAPTTQNWSSAGSNWANSLVECDLSPSGHAIRCSYSGTTQTSGGMHKGMYDINLIENGATYTLSGWIRASKNCKVSFWNEWMVGIPQTDITTEWKYYKVTGVMDTSKTYKSDICYMVASYVEQGVWIEAFGFKLEKSNDATSWIPHTTDALYAGYSQDLNVVYDSSGYNNNGEIINNISIEFNSPRYNSCIHINTTNQKIKISNFPTAGFGNSYSFVWWEKISSVTPMHWGFADGIRLNGMYTGRLWNTGDSSNNPLYIPGTTTQVTAPTTGVWHHWAMIGDGTTCKVYQDGALWGQAKTYKAISGSTIYINGWDSGTSYCSDNASISDFRIYATALTAEQVKELYDTSATIDKNGNVYAREVIEE